MIGATATTSSVVMVIKTKSTGCTSKETWNAPEYLNCIPQPDYQVSLPLKGSSYYPRTKFSPSAKAYSQTSPLTTESQTSVVLLEPK